jgi:hypothetical protein
VTVLALNRLWLNLVATGEGVSGTSNRRKTQEFGVGGQIVKGANGRLRGTSVAGETGEFPYTYMLASAAVRDKLRGWQGQLVLARDHRGQKWYGMYFGLNVTEYMPADLCQVSFTLQMVTYVEG